MIYIVNQNSKRTQLDVCMQVSSSVKVNPFSMQSFRWFLAKLLENRL